MFQGLGNTGILGKVMCMCRFLARQLGSSAALLVFLKAVKGTRPDYK